MMLIYWQLSWRVEPPTLWRTSMLTLYLVSVEQELDAKTFAVAWNGDVDRGIVSHRNLCKLGETLKVLFNNLSASTDPPLRFWAKNPELCLACVLPVVMMTRSWCKAFHTENMTLEQRSPTYSEWKDKNRKERKWRSGRDLSGRARTLSLMLRACFFCLCFLSFVSTLHSRWGNLSSSGVFTLQTNKVFFPLQRMGKRVKESNCHS